MGPCLEARGLQSGEDLLSSRDPLILLGLQRSPMSIVIRERGLGENIALTFSIIAKNFPKLALLSLMFGLPALVPQILAVLNPDPWIIDLGALWGLDEPIPLETAALFGGLLAFLIYPLFIGSLIGIVTGCYTGENITIGKSFGLALRRFFPLAIFSFVSNLIFFAAMFAVLLVGAVVPFFMILGVPLAIFLAGFFVTMFYVGSPSIVAENIGPIAALRRSAWLTKGSRGHILVFLILMWMLVVGIAMVFMMPVMVINGIESAMGGDGGSPGFLPLILGWVVNSIVGLLNVIAPVVIYFQTRARRESFQLTSVAELVDRIEQRRMGSDPQD